MGMMVEYTHTLTRTLIQPVVLAQIIFGQLMLAVPMIVVWDEALLKNHSAT